MKIGLEVEYWLVDGDGELIAVPSELPADHDFLEEEFIPPLLEVLTPPASSHEELRTALVDRLEATLELVDEYGYRLVPLGSPLARESLSITSERGKVLQRIYGEELEYAKHCAGTHVHFDKAEVVRQLNLLTGLDPALALVNSSPYYSSSQVASSSRAAVYRYEAHREFARYRDLWDYVSDIEEWNARVEEHHRDLRRIAEEVGIDREQFERYFPPESSVFTPVRLREQSPTVEWRAPDTALPSQTLRLVEDVERLLAQTEYKEVAVGETGVWADRIGVPPFSELQELSREAISDGLRSLRVQDYLATMGFDVTRYDPIADRIERNWTIPRERALEIRLRFADELEADVERLS
ncbi:glutamate-cysteine ligase family protein [Halomarina halobia]|uniref:Glutamate-cysteine ligase family protein n=1 Tax=Halomarina halobia TaxID=3033386 RepID=A0ABD6A6P0_9EURY|nr:glutamate-cysteine ligase family protein [Halomarina sp. PSR21]